VLNLYTGETVVRPDGYSVETESRQQNIFWKPAISFSRLQKSRISLGIALLPI